MIQIARFGVIISKMKYAAQLKPQTSEIKDR